ncbi:dihydroorotase [Cutibacterium acnes JCM 18920]|nr:dihydroorotase [Cutibacterium acnes JCM 18920]
MSRRVLLTGLTMLVGATPVPSQLLIRDERIELFHEAVQRPRRGRC